MNWEIIKVLKLFFISINNVDETEYFVTYVPLIFIDKIIFLIFRYLSFYFSEYILFQSTIIHMFFGTFIWLPLKLVYSDLRWLQQ